MSDISNITPQVGSINANEIPLERLAGNSSLSEPERVAAVSRHFEAIFLRHFLMEAQKPLLNPKDPMGNSSNQIYRDMMVNHLADEISKSGSFGLAKFYQQQLTPRQSSADNGSQGTTATGDC